MARKRSELVEALQSVRPDPQIAEQELARVIAEHTARAKQSLTEKGLARRPDESEEAWIGRMMAYCREKISGIGKQDTA